MTKKYLLIIFGLLLFFAIAFVYLDRSNRIAQENQTEAPLTTAAPVLWKEASPSAYATDSAVLKIEADLWLIKEKLERVDLDEAGLRPPALDLQIKY